jgi:thioredoxin 2
VASTIVTCPNCGKRNRLRATPTGVPQCAVCGTKLPWLVDADPESFEAETTASVPVVVDFWAPWCGPCRMVSPAVERLAEANPGQLKVVKLNVDEAPEIGARYGVQGIPLLLLMRDGQAVDRLVGAVPEPQIREWVARLSRPSRPAASPRPRR